MYSRLDNLLYIFRGERAMNHEAYLKLFLDENDVPPGMNQTQDSRARGADPNDHAFLQYRGENSGLAVWIAPETAPVWRLVDIRWVFSTDQDADAYHRNTLHINCEAEPLVQDAPLVGMDCHVFGGTKSDYSLYQITGVATSISQFYYIFRVGCVVAKLYVAEGEMASQSGVRLHAGMVKQIADKIVARINYVLQNPVEASAKPPLWKRFFS
jgi:hypothetical protein